MDEQNPEENRVGTGIQILDDTLGGGFQKGQAVLVSGDSGTGKTIMSLQFLMEGVKEEEKGLYISMTEPLFKTISNLKTFSFYREEPFEENMVVLEDMRHLLSGMEPEIEKIVDKVSEKVVETGAERVVIDSVTAIAYMLESKTKIRELIFRLGTMLATIGCTTYLTSEVTNGDRPSAYGVEEFIADSIIMLRQSSYEGGLRERNMDILKSRGTNINSSRLDFKIDSSGIRVFPSKRRGLEEIETSDTKVSIGNPGLDHLLDGGVYKNSSTLISGPTGTGKTLSCLKFIEKSLEEGKRCVYVSFEESEKELIRTARGFNIDLEDRDNLEFYTAYAGENPTGELLDNIVRITEEQGTERIAVDSLSAVQDTHSNSSYRHFVERLNTYLKTGSITSVYTYALQGILTGRQKKETFVSTEVDNLINLRHAEISGELKHFINIIKMRGSGHSKGLHSYNITGDGMIIGPSGHGYVGILSGVGQKVSETVEEQISDLFQEYLGPISSVVVNELSEKGFSEENIVNTIRKFERDDVIEEETAEEFINRIRKILERNE